jgi:uncharacterized membrane protein YhaH (DUF805 family)
MPQAELREPASNETYEPKFFAMSGRIGRVRYLGYSVALGLLLMPVFIIFLLVMGASVIAGRGVEAISAGFVFGLLALTVVATIAGVSIGRRRLHDLGKSGWYLLLSLVPLIGFLFALYLIFAPGESEANDYGPPPGPNSIGVIILASLMPIMFAAGVALAIAMPGYADYKARAEAAQVDNSQ